MTVINVKSIYKSYVGVFSKRRDYSVIPFSQHIIFYTDRYYGAVCEADIDFCPKNLSLK